ncbi:Growth-regulating factor 12 [Apostasia shenzhenica]|uniref:Growth-regulating factor n=1 Tax=Apostasia shenzhenica TaxID=1088818 RepID=A0A2I0AF87_9ASPA|nr:Growth-regulating factor 12 [Apostasia shenzhenica]
MEPEPGRCRRTDGKKWRCSRDVVPDHKYCERHVHRGRNRSRKPVDARGAAAKSSTNGIQLMPAAHRPNSGDGAEKMSTSPAMLFSPGSGLRASAAACSTAGYS